jgi:hypothetical protein
MVWQSKLDMSEQVHWFAWLGHLFICTDRTALSLVQGLESEDDDKKPDAEKAESAK